VDAEGRELEVGEVGEAAGQRGLEDAVGDQGAEPGAEADLAAEAVM